MFVFVFILMFVFRAGWLVFMCVLHNLCRVVAAAYYCCFHSSGMARFASRLTSPLHLQATPQAKHQEQRGLLLNIVVTQSTPVVELLAGEDEALLVGRHALLVLNLLLDVVDGVARVHVEGGGAAHESLDEDLYVEEYVLFVVVLRWGLLLENEDERAFYPLIS